MAGPAAWRPDGRGVGFFYAGAADNGPGTRSAVMGVQIRYLDAATGADTPLARVELEAGGDPLDLVGWRAGGLPVVSMVAADGRGAVVQSGPGGRRTVLVALPAGRASVIEVARDLVEADRPAWPRGDPSPWEAARWSYPWLALALLWVSTVVVLVVFGARRAVRRRQLLE